MKFEVIVDKSIESAIRRIIISELGNVPTQITRKDKEIYTIDIDYEMSIEQKVNIRDQIITIFENKDLIVFFKVL